MNKNKNAKIIVVIVLIIAMFGYSIGFSTYTTTLKIQNVQAIVKGESSRFKVTLSTKSDSTDTNGANINKGESYGQESAGLPNIPNDVTMSDIAIYDIGGTFNSKGGLYYSFFVRNIGDMDAYLTNVIFSSAKPICNSALNLQNVCGNVTMKFQVMDKNNQVVYVTDSNGQDYVYPPKNLRLKSGEFQKILISFSYTGIATVSERVSVDFGKVTLNYSSQDNT